MDTMAPILVIYATTEGQTKRVADRIALRLRDKGADVEMLDAGSGPSWPQGRFEAAFLAGSLHMGRHQKSLIRFVKSNRQVLSAMPAAFVSVSLSASGKIEEDVAAAHRCARQFFDETGWEADCLHLAAGAIRDNRLNFFKRLILHRILRSKGVQMDKSGEMEFTDWAALDAFVDQFMQQETGPARKRMR